MRGWKAKHSSSENKLEADRRKHILKKKQKNKVVGGGVRKGVRLCDHVLMGTSDSIDSRGR